MKTPAQKTNSKRPKSTREKRSGFTLVEMLVSVVLVLLMMLMFTQIFEILSGSTVKQRGLSENDQRARLLTTILKADLDNRTFQYLLPFARRDNDLAPGSVPPANDDPRSELFRESERRGYFYISENDPNDTTDDLLQLTVSRTANPSLTDQPFYFGKATDLSNRLAAPNNRLSANPNQPDADDARLVSDQTSQSSAAEVCYFLRGSNLYRRQMLLREPLGLTEIVTSQPEASSTSGSEAFFIRPDDGTPLYGQGYAGTDNFWGDFDSSAFRLVVGMDRYARFHDIGSLDNTQLGPFSADYPLGMPLARFGFNHATGRSREFATYLPETGPIPPVSPIPVFMGRFTQGETSHSTFNYPHDLTHSSVGGGGNPMDAASGPQFYVVPDDRSLVAFNDPNDRTSGVSFNSNGPRRSEDLVLSNVISFDVKVFDDAAGIFVDIGGPAANTFSTAKNQNGNAGNLQYNNIFDTWHPSADVGGDLDAPYPLISPYDVTNVDVDSGTAGTQLPTPNPLRAIQIIIQYKDVSSGQLRQISLIHPLRK
ncbi:hypothetical protein Pan241w_52310 [Gimesia alba]|uniref:Uncharacterized protein n=1 Tax=Gimesia alba TaxID=2527973 RepID=A0A517RML7_9PLAN|nr:prepilin-type N-terminal cleavage/methylation domain-containing protein [Gimesia alba]QDT45113.1 hypothetical protein Pan241w_52310 [Gimesia alba]